MVYLVVYHIIAYTKLTIASFLVVFRSPVYTAEWTTFREPLGSIVHYGQPVRSRGAYVARHSQDGRLVAVAVNQHTSHLNRMIFFSPTTDTMMVIDLKGCGAKRPVAEEHR